MRRIEALDLEAVRPNWLTAGAIRLGLLSLLLLRNLHVQRPPRPEGMDLRGAGLLAAAPVSLQLGVAHATLQCADLLRRGAPGIHFYTLNRSPATRAILAALRASEPWLDA